MKLFNEIKNKLNTDDDDDGGYYKRIFEIFINNYENIIEKKKPRKSN